MHLWHGGPLATTCFARTRPCHSCHGRSHIITQRTGHIGDSVPFRLSRQSLCSSVFPDLLSSCDGKVANRCVIAICCQDEHGLPAFRSFALIPLPKRLRNSVSTFHLRFHPLQAQRRVSFVSFAAGFVLLFCVLRLWFRFVCFLSWPFETLLGKIAS